MKSLLALVFTLLTIHAYSQPHQKDSIPTSAEALFITFIGHGSLMMEYQKQVIHIDPSSREADYSLFPKADLILITHHHGDHCDPKAFELVNGDSTTTILTQLAADKLGTGNVLSNGNDTTYKNIKVEALPAYNLVHKRENGEYYHPKGCCNSYVLTLGDKRVFIGGDTENTPEMKALKDIDIAFLPMNLPYTMTPEMVADAAKAFRPKVLYPYHYGKTDVSELLKLMTTENDIEIRIRDME